jgi:hypothetical protein
MSGPQYIFLGLIGITTWGAFVEATGYRGYRRTPTRYLLALLVPIMWAALIVLPPWDSWAAIFRHTFVQILLLAFLIIGAPAGFVATIVIWVGAALTGDLQDSLRVLSHRLYNRRKNK